MRSFFTLTLIAALTAAAPLAHGPYHAKARSLAPPPLAGREVGIDGTCGPIWGGSTCAPGLCCSAQGYCGVSDAYCGTGCQSPFGTCGASSGASAASSSVAASVPVPTTPVVPSVPAVSVPVVSESSSAEAPAPTTAAPLTTAIPATTAAIVAPAASSAPAVPLASSPPSVVGPTSNSQSNGGDSNSGSSSSSGLGLGDKYTMYNGDGSTADGWPSQSDWMSFDDMWESNMQYISISCEDTFSVPNNSDEESAELKAAIQSVAQSSGVDERFILAVVMQESKGCVRAPTTANAVANPGLMQSHEGSGSCNSATGGLQNPCPSGEITQMIEDGTDGTPTFGLKQCLQSAPATGAIGDALYYVAARTYNSGSVPTSLDLGAIGATRCYASDIANRLTGWVTATTLCDLVNP